MVIRFWLTDIVVTGILASVIQAPCYFGKFPLGLMFTDQKVWKDFNRQILFSLIERLDQVVEVIVGPGGEGVK